MDKIGFIITYYNSSLSSEKILRRNLEIISKENYYVILAAHSPVDIEIQKMCDFYFYQEQNIVDNLKWSHGVAENNLIELSFLHLKFKGIKWTYKLCYDVYINDLAKLLEWQKNMEYDYVSCQWGDNIISTNSFFASRDFVLDNIRFYHTIDEMFSVARYLEACWEHDIKSKNLESRIFTYPNKDSFMGLTNSMDVISHDYNKFDFWYKDAECKFYIENSGKDFKGWIAIYDYYTDLCIYYNYQHEQIANSTMWILPPFSGYMNLANNGYYLVTNLNNVIVRRNFGIKDFDLKHPLSKKYRSLFYKEEYFKDYIENTLPII